MPRPDVVLNEPRLFRDARAELGESPFWSDGALVWVDIPAGELHVSPGDGPADGASDTVHRLPAPLASVQPADLVDGRSGWIAALGDSVVLVGTDGRIVEEVARVSHPAPGARLNEGGCDPQGRFVVGSMNAETDESDAAWYRVGPGGARLLRDGVGTTNALEWSLDGRTVYLGDTDAGTIAAASWDPDDGPGEPRPWRTGSPADGMAIDVEGCFWNALNGEGVVVRLDPQGDEIARIALPAPAVSGVAFGGEGLSTLFVCSAREGMSEEDLRQSPLSGGVFAIDVAVGGLPVRRYRA